MAAFSGGFGGGKYLATSAAAAPRPHRSSLGGAGSLVVGARGHGRSTSSLGAGSVPAVPRGGGVRAKHRSAARGPKRYSTAPESVASFGGSSLRVNVVLLLTRVRWWWLTCVWACLDASRQGFDAGTAGAPRSHSSASQHAQRVAAERRARSQVSHRVSSSSQSAALSRADRAVDEFDSQVAAVFSDLGLDNARRGPNAPRATAANAPRVPQPGNHHARRTGAFGGNASSQAGPPSASSDSDSGSASSGGRGSRHRSRRHRSRHKRPRRHGSFDSLSSLSSSGDSDDSRAYRRRRRRTRRRKQRGSGTPSPPPSPPRKPLDVDAANVEAKGSAANAAPAGSSRGGTTTVDNTAAASQPASVAKAAKHRRSPKHIRVDKREDKRRKAERKELRRLAKQGVTDIPA